MKGGVKSKGGGSQKVRKNVARASCVHGLAPSGDGARNDGPLVAVNGVRCENLPVLLLRERPALHRRIQLIAPPVFFFFLR